MRRHRRHPIIITPVTETKPAQDGVALLVAGEHLAPPPERPRRNPWAWGAALLLHVLVIAAVLLVREKPPQEDLQSPPGVSVVFNNGGTAPQATAPKAMPGPPQQMQAPPPPPPPPASPAEQAQAATQDEVQVPDLPLAVIPNAPPAPRPRPAPRLRRPGPSSEQKYVFLNGMSYGNISPAAPPAPPAPRGMNFSLPASDAQAATASDFSVKGDAGADWDAALTKWVQEHAYYPQAAAEQGQQGTATVEFTVDRHGHVTGLKLLDSAGSPFLDQAWEQLFEDNILPPFPPDAKDGHVKVQYTVHYVLIH